MRALVGIVVFTSVIQIFGYSVSRPFSKIGVSSVIQSSLICQQERPPLPSRQRTGLLGSRCQDKDSVKVSKGLNVLELTGSLIPQGYLVKIVKAGWSTFWQIFMRELAPQDRSGGYVRPTYGFRGEISAGAAAEFPDEPGRYHLYVGKACPWCHRAELARAVLGLGDYLSVTIVADRPEEASRGGWVFDAADPDPVFGARDLRQVYDAAAGGYRGRCTAPLLVCKKTRRIVCNESSLIVRMLNRLARERYRLPAGPGPDGGVIDLYPPALQAEIEALNAWIYEDVNNGVYRCGFATSQAAYDAAVAKVFAGLDRAEGILAGSRFLTGPHFTEADLRLFPTAFRFDAVYHPLFKCSKRRLVDYPSLKRWLGDVHGLPGVASTCDLEATRRSYYGQLFPLNPGGIVPAGPALADLGLALPPPPPPGGAPPAFVYR